MKPHDIEAQSMRIIERELKEQGLWDGLEPQTVPLVMRAIHTTADFDYAQNLVFQHEAVRAGLKALHAGATIVSDTNMIAAGVSKPATAALGCDVVCYMADKDVANEARERGVTRATVSMERALREHPGAVFAVGNAPTALMALHEGIVSGAPKPALIIAVPVGFVNVVESKELILALDVPSIVAKGRKGGSTVAVSLLNALLYELYHREG